MRPGLVVEVEVTGQGVAGGEHWRRCRNHADRDARCCGGTSMIAVSRLPRLRRSVASTG